MSNHSDEFYTSAIKTVFPTSWDVRRPNVCGVTYPVFLADTPNGTVVCKFNNTDILFKNHKVSNLAQLYDIPVPRTRVRAYLDTWFETYTYCPDKTLYERIKANATDAQIFNAYKQIIDIQNRISQIGTDEFKADKARFMSDVFAIQHHNRFGKISYAYSMLHPMFSRTGTMRLLHNDLNPKNILADNNCQVSRLIDLDGIALCNDSFSVLMMFRTYPLNNHNEIMDYYEDTTERLLNRRTIMSGLKILRRIRKPLQYMHKSFLGDMQR